MEEGLEDDSPILVGELNPYGSDPRYALWPVPARSAGGRLQSLVLNISLTHYVRLKRHNLCVGRWSARDARTEAERLREAYPTQTLVLLGRKVAQAFGLEETAPYTVRDRFVLLPHPSGLCREWNDPGAVGRARAVLRVASPAWAERVRLDAP